MTFLEAAIAILKSAGKPLHFKDLTETALRENMLTVVGKTPEATMQQRLNDALKKDDNGPLERVKPGIYGLRFYPPPAKPSVPANAAAETVAAPPGGVGGEARSSAPGAGEPSPGAPAGPRDAAAGAAEGRRRRRRGGRGRKRHPEGSVAVGAQAPGAAASGDEGEEDGDGDEGPAIVAVAASGPAASIANDGSGRSRPASPPVAAPSAGPERRSFAEAAALVAGARAQSDTPAPSRASISALSAPLFSASPEIREPEPAAIAAGDEPLDEDLGDEIDAESGPLIAPTLGTEEMVRGEGHRPVFAPGQGGGRRRRGRDRGRDRGAGGGAPGGAGRGGPSHGGQRAEPHHARGPGHDRPHAPQASHARGGASGAGPSTLRPEGGSASVAAPDAAALENRAGEARGGEPRSPAAPVAALVDMALELLRGGDGRPQHVKQLVDAALKRHLTRGDAPELWRAIRLATHVELRAREGMGLRPRVRPLGGGHLALGDRKLDAELATYEREVGERAARLSEATRVALHRRLARLPPALFEAVARVLLDRLGVTALEAVKRGDGVVYLGGERSRGVRRHKVLVSVRPGEGEIRRRAVGELRAGLKVRGYDEGICLAAGRAGGEALAELSAGDGPIELYDGDALATLCSRLGVGVHRRAVVIDTLDVDFFSELSDG